MLKTLRRCLQAAVPEYAFEMAGSNVRFGQGVTKEVGMDMAGRAKNVMVLVDPHVANLPPLQVVLESLEQAKVKATVFSDISVEPTDASFKRAIAFAQEGNFDGFVALGGGSTMDTAKAANLYASYPTDNFLDYVNAPIGGGKVPPGELKPLIAIPTTCGTASEVTGIAIFDYVDMKAKTGIGHRRLKPSLGLVDPDNTKDLPHAVAVSTGFDVLTHAIESYTAVPYQKRGPAPASPLVRPTYQGSNPISDVWALHALNIIKQYFKRSLNGDDVEARSMMMLAATYAGIGFGNAGVHLPHGMSYPISGMVSKYTPKGYDVNNKPIVPHGIAVCINAPAVFRWTGDACPDRHIKAAELLGFNVDNAKGDAAGPICADAIRTYMQDLGMPDGLNEMGYTSADIPQLVKGTLPQQRVTKLSPKTAGPDELAALFEDTMKIY
eukprot:TRINITY_DN60876_c0_g1_i1.p1 TRINITY_DN60876_c0_g1~~TRINITY_DN60876_c0_g1_i1.p1  ORF type:complete len:438 (-),score=37.52 TRINITY_DN60876_c0_g1_i1:114-1427(-)